MIIATIEKRETNQMTKSIITSTLTKTLAALTMWAIAGTASAVSITPDASGAVLDVGQEITVTIIGDFQDDPTLGGGLDIDWDTSVLSLLSFTPIDWGNDAGFFNPGTVSDGSVDGFAAGNFNGVAGPVDMAVLVFVAVGEGQSLHLSDDSDGLAGPFVSAGSFAIQDVDFGANNDAGHISVAASAVPVPAALWLMIAGLGSLLGFRRKA